MGQFFRSERGQRTAWYLYDFGNSAYAAVVLLAIYSAYFKDGVVGGAEGSRLWGIAVAIAMLVSACISPVLGAIADRLAVKKRMLAIFTTISIAFTGCLFFVGKGDVWTGMLFFILAEIGYRAAQVYYDALLPEIAPRSQFGRVSGRGWAIGSLGGILCLGIVLPMVVLVGDNFVLRLTMVVTALWYLVFSLPLFLFVEEKARPTPLAPGESIWTIGFRQLWSTVRRLREHREYVKFMIAFILFNDGVMIALDFAAIIGAVLYGFAQEQLIVLIILVQLTNVAGAYAFGYMSDMMSAKSALGLSLVVMIGAVLWLAVNGDPAMFCVICSVAGFAIAGLQSVSRSMVAKLVPAGRAGEFYGLFAVAGRSSSVVGPALFGIAAAEGAIWYAGQGMGEHAAEQAGMRLAVYVILAFLVVGGVLLAFVREDEGAAAAEAHAKPAV